MTAGSQPQVHLVLRQGCASTSWDVLAPERRRVVPSLDRDMAQTLERHEASPLTLCGRIGSFSEVLPTLPDLERGLS